MALTTSDEVEALLGRSLSAVETKNFDLYEELAEERLADVTCLDLAEIKEMSSELKLLLARTFDLIVKEQAAAENHGVSSKKVEDFSINYSTDSDSPYTAYLRLNSALIAKYSACQGPVEFGGAEHGDCIRCI